MGNLKPLEEGSIKRARPSQYLFRAAACHLRAYAQRTTPEAVAKQSFNDPVTGIILKAATAPATTVGSGWADSLAALSIRDLVMEISSVSAAAALIQRGLQLDFGHFASIRVPGRLVDANDAGSWVPEGTPITVRAQRITAGPSLTPHKLVVLTSFTNEMAQQSNIEEISRALLTESCALALDTAVFSTSPAGNAPGGILYGVTPIGSTAGGGFNALTADIANLMKSLVQNYAGRDPVLIMNPTQATSLRTMASPLFKIPILESTVIAPGTVVLVEPSSFVSAFSPTPEFDVVDTPSIHFEDTAPQNITGGTPSPAVPVRSLFQVDSIGLRLKLRAAWGMRMPSTNPHVAYITGTTW
jgi:hypothetical protein